MGVKQQFNIAMRLSPNAVWVFIVVVSRCEHQDIACIVQLQSKRTNLADYVTADRGGELITDHDAAMEHAAPLRPNSFR